MKLLIDGSLVVNSAQAHSDIYLIGGVVVVGQVIVLEEYAEFYLTPET